MYSKVFHMLAAAHSKNSKSIRDIHRELFKFKIVTFNTMKGEQTTEIGERYLE